MTSEIANNYGSGASLDEGFIRSTIARPSDYRLHEVIIILSSINMKLSAACAFVVGTVALDIGSTISTTEASGATVSAVERSTKKTKKNGVQTTPAATPAFSALAVQDGRVCSIETDTMGTYTLRATLANETVLFLERPDRRAAKISTQAFVESFDGLFKSSSPNVAITFTGDAALDGPLIVVLSQPRIIGGLDDGSSTLGVEYTMEQSESQSTVAAIEQFLEASGSCSVFIDSLAPFCVPLENGSFKCFGSMDPGESGGFEGHDGDYQGL